jgi:leader peptidase (prepilin peptidase)/N-methyltransferase
MEIGASAVALSAILVTSGWMLWATSALGWTLLALAVIDWRHWVLPDELTMPLTPAGLLVAVTVGADATKRRHCAIRVSRPAAIANERHGLAPAGG